MHVVSALTIRVSQLPHTLEVGHFSNSVVHQLERQVSGVVQL